MTADEIAVAWAALMKAQSVLNPLSGFLRYRYPEKAAFYLEGVRDEIRNAIAVLEHVRRLAERATDK